MNHKSKDYIDGDGANHTAIAFSVLRRIDPEFRRRLTQRGCWMDLVRVCQETGWEGWENAWSAGATYNATQRGIYRVLRDLGFHKLKSRGIYIRREHGLSELTDEDFSRYIRAADGGWARNITILTAIRHAVGEKVWEDLYRWATSGRKFLPPCLAKKTRGIVYGF